MPISKTNFFWRQNWTKKLQNNVSVWVGSAPLWSQGNGFTCHSSVQWYLRPVLVPKACVAFVLIESVSRSIFVDSHPCYGLVTMTSAADLAMAADLAADSAADTYSFFIPSVLINITILRWDGGGAISGIKTHDFLISLRFLTAGLTFPVTSVEWYSKVISELCQHHSVYYLHRLS